MSHKIDLSKELKEAMADSCKAAQEDLRQTIERAGKAAAKRLKTAGSFKNRTGGYRKSWTTSTDETAASITVVVHAKSPHYRQAHLLENGHLSRDGRTRVKAFPHLDEAEQAALQEIERELGRLK